MIKYTIGADPELFVEDDNGVFMNGYGLIPGTKEEPFRVQDGAVQVDGMALEFNVDPASTREEFVHNVDSVRAQLNAMITKGRVVAKPVAKFDRKWFSAQPAESRIMGCDPDYNAWTGEPNMPPDNKRPMRTAAGHIHIGWTSDKDQFDYEHFCKCAEIIRHLDSTVGLWTVIEDPGSHERRSMYGCAGAFRPKPYGVEYRVPSNFWVDGRAGEIYDRVMDSLRLLDNGDDRTNEAVVDIINNSDIKAAQELIAA